MFKYYLLDGKGSVINECDGPSPNHIKLPVCPNLSEYIYNGSQWILNQEKQTKSKIDEIYKLLDLNKQKLVENKVIYTETDPNFSKYEEKYRQQRETLLIQLKQLKN